MQEQLYPIVEIKELEGRYYKIFIFEDGHTITTPCYNPFTEQSEIIKEKDGKN